MDPPWLIDRRGEGYVQVTELLYRIAEVLDGEHTFDQIAEHVSQATGRSVTAANVQQLVLSQFVQRGLVPLADGRVIGSRSSNRSLLQINMRMRAVDARTIDPLIRVLRWLYWPPILLLVLAAGLSFEVWLYFVHGIAAGVREALYAPALLLITVGATILAAAFHELGHAAALRYGGGTPRAMGAGMYLVYPAFYTDVSDNYRLGRWARVRTDLGGFYFNLLFALGILGLYAMTGQEVLLLIVSFLNLEVLRQLAPLMRLDGYWALADLTGVPDFISHMGAFLRSLVPGARGGARQLPRLKPWAKLVFLAYVLIAVPLLLLQLTTMVRGVPRLLATVWDSAGRQFGVIQQAQASGQMLVVLLAALQLVALLLPTLAVVLGIGRFGRRAVVGLWRWSQPSLGRRVVAGVGSLIAIGFLAYAWLPSGAPAPGAAGAAGAPSTLSGQASYQPIQPNERGTFGDMAAGVVATSEPRPTPSVAAATAEPTVAATATLELTPTTETTAATTETTLPTQVATPTTGRALVTATPRAVVIATSTAVRPAATDTAASVATTTRTALPARTPASTATATSG